MAAQMLTWGLRTFGKSRLFDKPLRKYYLHQTWIIYYDNLNTLIIVISAFLSGSFYTLDDPNYRSYRWRTLFRSLRQN